MKKQQQTSLFWGVFLLLIGAIFLLNNLGFDIDIEEIFLTYWPLILILVGLKNLWPHLQKREKTDSPSPSGDNETNR